MKPENRSRAGITLIEMLVVVMIIGLFVAIVGVKVVGYGTKAQRTAARAQINEFKQALDLYKMDVGTYPSTEQGLQALRVKPEGADGWEKPYISRDVPLDPWKHAYVYKFPGDHGDEPDIISYGADGEPGGDGDAADIVSWDLH